MFYRKIQIMLLKWAESNPRKPLILRGARQVGKTTAVKQFAKSFDSFISLNLEKQEDAALFNNYTTMEALITLLFFTKNIEKNNKKKILIFIDEIQERPAVINLLRYFYEDMPHLYVIAAGSMLETLFKNEVQFPVGRVTYLILRPASFEEFLHAQNATNILEAYHKMPFENFAFEKTLAYFNTYALIGGMPEIVHKYSTTNDVVVLHEIYENLINSYLNDVEKYAKSTIQVNHLRHAIKSCFANAGKRIKLAQFGNSNYGSREMGEALHAIEKAMLLQLVYPLNSTVLPMQPVLKKAPKLQFFDTGLINYSLGLHTQILQQGGVNNVYNGLLVEHLVGQEILAHQYNVLSSLNFWTREKNTSNAEVDYVIKFENILIPIEVKAGKEGVLKSLHLFMDEAPHNMAIRLYKGVLNITKPITTNGKTYFLLNLPYFLAGKIEAYLPWFKAQIKNN